MGKVIALFGIMMISMCVLSSCTDTSPRTDGDQDLNLLLSFDRMAYEEGQSISATITLKNQSKEAIVVNGRLALNAPESPDAVRDLAFHIATPSNQELPLAARVNVRLLKDTDFVTLSPGVQIQRTYRLDQFYRFVQTGAFEAYVVYQNQSDPSDSDAAWKGELRSNTVGFIFGE